MKKTINFGKIDGYGNGRKTCPVEITIELEEDNGRAVFSCTGIVWNHLHTDAIMGGQCLDSLAKTRLRCDKTFLLIYRLWKSYHLNDMHAGTEAQEKAIEEWKSNGNRYDYTAVCGYLDSIGLLEDSGYRYGTSWLYREIPQDDLNIIRGLIQG